MRLTKRLKHKNKRLMCRKQVTKKHKYKKSHMRRKLTKKHKYKKSYIRRKLTKKHKYRKNLNKTLRRKHGGGDMMEILSKLGVRKPATKPSRAHGQAPAKSKINPGAELSEAAGAELSEAAGAELSEAAGAKLSKVAEVNITKALNNMKYLTESLNTNLQTVNQDKDIDKENTKELLESSMKQQFVAMQKLLELANNEKKINGITYDNNKLMNKCVISGGDAALVYERAEEAANRVGWLVDNLGNFVDREGARKAARAAGFSSVADHWEAMAAIKKDTMA